MSDRALIQIPIGDWSGDGHGHCDWFVVSYNAECDITKAFLAAAELHPELRPDKFCDEYDDTTVPQHIVNVCLENNLEFVEIEHYNGEDYYHLDSDNFVKYVIWFINLGDPDIDVQYSPENAIPRWHTNWAAQAVNPEGPLSQIGFFGYGITSY